MRWVVASEDWEPIAMYAIVRTGGRQFRAQVGESIEVERMPNPVDSTVDLTEVLLIENGENTLIGQPTVEGAVVRATVIDQYRAKKVIVFKYRQRTTYRRKRGHRHYYTRLRIDEIVI